MRLGVLGSGSAGNAFLLTHRGESLLIDAGFGPRSLAKRMQAFGARPESIAGIVLTHEHGDHAKGVARMARRLGCPVYATRGTLGALGARVANVPAEAVPGHGTFRIGAFRVSTCRTTHDAAEPIALSVSAPGSGKIGLAYDVGRPTAALRYLLRSCTTLLVEANHDDLMLQTGPYPPSVRQRIAGSSGHLSNRAAAELIEELHHRRLASVVLVHLSATCNTPGHALKEVRERLRQRGFTGEVLVAAQHEPLPPLQVSREPWQLELGVFQH